MKVPRPLQPRERFADENHEIPLLRGDRFNVGFVVRSIGLLECRVGWSLAFAASKHMQLTEEEQRILVGAFGEPQRIALGVLAKLGDRMIEISSRPHRRFVVSDRQRSGDPTANLSSKARK